MVHADQSFWIPGSGWRFEGWNPARRPSSTADSRIVGFGGAFGRTPLMRRTRLRILGASSGTVSTAGASGVSLAARAMSKTRQAVAASKARHLRRSSAWSNLRSSTRSPDFRTRKNSSIVQRLR